MSRHGVPEVGIQVSKHLNYPKMKLKRELHTQNLLDGVIANPCFSGFPQR